MAWKGAGVGSGSTLKFYLLEGEKATQNLGRHQGQPEGGLDIPDLWVGLTYEDQPN